MTDQTIPPHDLEAEESLLGAMMLSRGATEAAREAGLTNASFYKPGHGAVFDAIESVIDSGALADPVSVAAMLNGDLDHIGGRAALARLEASTPASANAPAYARIVADHARRRMAIGLATDLRDAALASNCDAMLRDTATRLGALVGPVESDPTWLRVDLGPALAGAVERVTPTVFTRDDGRALFYPRRVNGLHGDSGIGKSMVVAVAVAQELNAGHDVGWIDLEDPDPTTLIERLRLLGVNDRIISGRFHYYAPHEPFTDAAVAALARDATGWAVLVIDSMGEAFGLEGLDENKDVDVGPWLRRVARVLADAGPAVVLIDHSTKAADNPLHPSGSKRKRAAITGASYLLDVIQPLTRDAGGKLRLVCAKDRHGSYRRGDVVAVVDMAVYPDKGVSVKVWPADAQRRPQRGRSAPTARSA